MAEVLQGLRLPQVDMPGAFSRPALSSPPSHVQTELLAFVRLLASLSGGSPFMFIFVSQSPLPPFLLLPLWSSDISVTHTGLQGPLLKCLCPARNRAVIPRVTDLTCSPAGVTSMSPYNLTPLSTSSLLDLVLPPFLLSPHSCVPGSPGHLL